MDFDLPDDRSRTTVPIPPGMALAVATIVAAGVTGLAVAGLTWTLDRPIQQQTGAPPDVAFERTPEPSASGPIDTPGWAEALGLPAPAPVPPGPAPVDGAGAVAAPPAPPGQEETVRRAAAARRPVVGPTASVRSTPSATTATSAAPAAGGPSATTGPGVADGVTPDPGAGDVTDPAAGAAGPATGPAADPAAGLDAGAGTGTDAEPTATETAAPQRRWQPPRRTWHDDGPRPAPAPQWGGPFGDFPGMFPWG